MRSFLSLLLLASWLSGCQGCAPVAPEPRAYRAEIRRTAFGVPHIVGDSLGDVAFGQGYAFAEDHPCVLADQVVKVRGERARFFGRGEDDANVESDFAYLALDVHARAGDALARQSEEARALVRGFAAGYNARLAEVGVDGLPAPCTGAPWVQPLTEQDLFAYHLDLALLGSGRQLLPLIASAQPPSSGALFEVPAAFPDVKGQAWGSNGWAIGRAHTESGGGLLLANPHFPWEGELTLYESHLTVPGVLDVYGASLMGVPGVLIGFNDDVAWTHTVSFAPRFTLYRLELHSGDATAYRFGDAYRQMTSKELAIEVLGEDGALFEETRTLWSSHHGPMLNMPLYGWLSDFAFSVRDANLENPGLIEQWLRFGQATSVEDLKAAVDEVQGIPWVHLMAVDRTGAALYADGSVVPHLAPEAVAAWQRALDEDFYTRTVYEQGAVLLDGSDPTTTWVDDPRAARPGIVPFEDAPSLVREDFVANANDSHWLANPEAPLEGFSPVYGEERTPRSARTRMNLRLLTERGEGALAPEGTFTLDGLADGILNNRALHAELLLDEALARCDGVSGLEAACAALGAWDRRLDLESRGAVLWREVLGAFDEAARRDAGALYAEPFDPEAPIDTPRGLAPAPDDEDDPLLAALVAAQERLSGQGLAVDVALGEVQFTEDGGARHPVHGGLELEGAANIVGQTEMNWTLLPRMDLGEEVSPTTGLTERGYPMNYGGSFLMVAEIDDGGPRAKAMLVYSQSSAPGPHAADQAALYGEKRWREVRFADEDVLADPELVTYEVKGTDEGITSRR